MHGFSVRSGAFWIASVGSVAAGQYSPFPGVYELPMLGAYRTAAMLQSLPGADVMCVASSEDASEVEFFRLEEDGRGLLPAGSLGFGSEGHVEFWVQDLDGDGDDDLIVATAGPGQVVVVLQEGGGFEKRAVIPVPWLTSIENMDLVAGDFDASGSTDIALVLPGSVEVFLASGPWAYGTSISTDVQNLFRPAAAFDVDGVPGDDIVATWSNGVAVISVVDAALTHVLSPNVGYRPDFVHAGVLRPAGPPEVLVADQRTGVVRVDSLGLIGGSLSVTATGELHGQAARLDVDDFDDDGLLDLLALGGASGVHFGIDSGSGSIPFETDRVALSAGLSWGGTKPVRSIDLNGDGFSDFVGRVGDGFGVRDVFAVILGDGQRFRSHILGTSVNPAGDEWLLPYPADDLEAGAILGLGESGPVVVAAATRDGSPLNQLVTREEPRIPLYDQSRVVFGDINGDGHSDYAGAARTVTSLDSNYIFWAIGDGQGGFGVSLFRDTARTSTIDIALHDLDRDGFDDAALASSAYLDVSLGRPSGMLAPEISIPIPYQSNSRGFFCDLDGDGFMDLIRRRSEMDTLQLLYGGPDLQFGGAVEIAEPAGAAYLTDGTHPLVDLNGDGVIDVAVPIEGGIAVALSAGPRSYGAFEHVPIPGGGGAGQIRVGNLDGDTYPDLVHIGPRGLTVFGLRADRRLGVVARVRQDSGFLVLHDVDQDGFTDMVTSNDNLTLAYINSGSVACLADYAPDGVLNFFDIQLFLGDLVGGVRFADLNEDGTVNFADLAMLVSIYNQGCQQ